MDAAQPGRRPASAGGEGRRDLTLTELRQAHLLLVSPGAEEDVARLVRDRHPDTDLLRHGEVVLGRHSRLIGAYELRAPEAREAAVPLSRDGTVPLAYALVAPVEREEDPATGLPDRDGLVAAFPAGLPWREEGRGIDLLLGLARRTGGSVRLAAEEGAAARGPVLLTPDPGCSVDHLVHAPHWLAPEQLESLVTRHLPTARLDIEGEEWTGPPDEAYSGEAFADDVAADPLSSEELDELHALVDAQDLVTLSEPDELDAYAVTGEFGFVGIDGVLEVAVRLGQPGEPVLEGRPWALEPFVTYEIRWHSPDPASRHSPPTPEFRRLRERVRPVVNAVTRSVLEATSGIAVDEDGFRVDRYRL